MLASLYQQQAVEEPNQALARLIAEMGAGGGGGGFDGGFGSGMDGSGLPLPGLDVAGGMGIMGLSGPGAGGGAGPSQRAPRQSQPRKSYEKAHNDGEGMKLADGRIYVPLPFIHKHFPEEAVWPVAMHADVYMNNECIRECHPVKVARSQNKTRRHGLGNHWVTGHQKLSKSYKDVRMQGLGMDEQTGRIKIMLSASGTWEEAGMAGPSGPGSSFAPSPLGGNVGGMGLFNSPGGAAMALVAQLLLAQQQPQLQAPQGAVSPEMASAILGQDIQEGMSPQFGAAPVALPQMPLSEGDQAQPQSVSLARDDASLVSNVVVGDEGGSQDAAMAELQQQQQQLAFATAMATMNAMQQPQQVPTNPFDVSGSLSGDAVLGGAGSSAPAPPVLGGSALPPENAVADETAVTDPVKQEQQLDFDAAAANLNMLLMGGGSLFQV